MMTRIVCKCLPARYLPHTPSGMIDELDYHIQEYTIKHPKGMLLRLLSGKKYYRVKTRLEKEEKSHLLEKRQFFSIILFE